LVECVILFSVKEKGVVKMNIEEIRNRLWNIANYWYEAKAALRIPRGFVDYVISGELRRAGENYWIVSYPHGSVGFYEDAVTDITENVITIREDE